MKEDTASKILQKLNEQESEEGNLPLLLEFYRKLVNIQSGNQQFAPENIPDAEALLQRKQKGFALLQVDDFNPDLSLVQDMYDRVRNVFADYPELFGENVVNLKNADHDLSLTGTVVKSWYSMQNTSEPALDEGNENLINALIQSTLQPFLTSYARALSGYLETEHWHRDYCPVCGGSPDLSFLKGDNNERWLLCSRCDTEWYYQRLKCPCCGNQEQNTLAFFSDEQGIYRLDVCEKCRSYLKTVDLRKGGGEAPVTLERLYTLDLDKQASELGYYSCQRPPVLGTN